MVYSSVTYYYYSQGYAKSQGVNEFFYLDKTRDTVLTGFAARHALLVNNAEVNVETPLNRYGFFEELHKELLPNTKLELKITFEDDNNLIWRTGGADCRVVITKFQLIIPRITLNASGLKLYSDDYFKNRKWSYLREVINSNDATQQASGNFRISTRINKPRYVFVFIINTADDNDQGANKFLYNTFTPANRRLTECHLVLGNGKDYPKVYYRPNTEPTRVFRDVLKYIHANSQYSHDTLLTRSNFSSIFSFVYFDLTRQSTDIRDGMTKLTFKYTLSGATNAAYKIYALVLHEQDVELVKMSNKVILRSM